MVSRPIWDAAFADELLGKRLLVGLNYLGQDGNLIEQQQCFGRVHELVQHSRIELTLEGGRHGEVFAIPPDMRLIVAASPGQYRLRSTDEVVVDPDYTVTFSIQKQSDEKREADSD